MIVVSVVCSCSAEGSRRVASSAEALPGRRREDFLSLFRCRNRRRAKKAMHMSRMNTMTESTIITVVLNETRILGSRMVPNPELESVEEAAVGTEISDDGLRVASGSGVFERCCDADVTVMSVVFEESADVKLEVTKFDVSAAGRAAVVVG